MSYHRLAFSIWKSRDNTLEGRVDIRAGEWIFSRFRESCNNDWAGLCSELIKGSRTSVHGSGRGHEPFSLACFLISIGSSCLTVNSDRDALAQSPLPLHLSLFLLTKGTFRLTIQPQSLPIMADVESGRRTYSPSNLLSFRLKTPLLRRARLLIIGLVCFVLFSFWASVPPDHGRLDHVPSFGKHAPQSSLGWLNPMNWRFFPAGARRQRIQRTRDRYALAPDDPFPFQLPPPHVIFSDVKTSHLPYPASHHRFPKEDLPDLYPAGPPDLEAEYEEHIVTPRAPVHAFIKNWTSPEWFDPEGRNARKLPRVQHDFTKDSVPRGRRKVNEERAEAVKRAFVHAWQQYKDHAWGESFILGRLM